MTALDGENTWVEFVNTLPSQVRRRFHRLNVAFAGPEPGLDDVSVMEDLKRKTSQCIDSEFSLLSVTDSILGSFFYFELQELPVMVDGQFECIGNIYCRFKNNSLALDRLLRRLIHCSAHFVVAERPVPCTGDMEAGGWKTFQRPVRFSVLRLSDEIDIHIDHITSQPVSISGFPQSVDGLIQQQQLYRPFGRSDHVDQTFDKPLPDLPTHKRKRDQCAEWI